MQWGTPSTNIICIWPLEIIKVTGGQTEVTEGQLLTTIDREAIFCIYTHIDDTCMIRYVRLGYNDIRGHHRSNGGH